jgi:parallel beta-helix repeat protein
MRKLFPAILLALAACHGGKTAPCAGVTGPCTGFSDGASESAVAAAFVTAQRGTVIGFGEGTFRFTNSLNLAAPGVTIRGAGLDKTVLDFSGQKGGSDGIFVADHSDDLLLQDFAVRNAKGNGFKVLGSSNVTFRRVKAEWTTQPAEQHGPYGIYPIQCKNVLIEDSVAIGASDSGFYIGQSDQIIIRGNTAQKNVAGIEIENSFNADVTNNLADSNTAGILVFDLPDLQQLGGHNIRVFNNRITNNNAHNFAAYGDIVGLVPAGTGFFVMANHDVEVFGNTVTGNNTAALGVISYAISGLDIHDAHYYQFPARIHIHDNTVSGNGSTPDPGTGIGTLFLSGLSSFPGGVIPALLYDGVVDPAVMGPSGNPMQICFKNNSGAAFSNLHLEKLVVSAAGSNFASIHTEDATAFTCALPALPPVTLTGH